MKKQSAPQELTDSPSANVVKVLTRKLGEVIYRDAVRVK